MTADHSSLDLIFNASLLVQFVMLILVVASIVSWTMIFNKRFLLKHSKNNADIFEILYLQAKSYNFGNVKKYN